jgi:DNA polymerase
MILHIDIETYSPEPIADSGLYRYAMHPDFDILLVAYARDNEPVRIVDLASSETLPTWFINSLSDDTVVKMAHNAAFERVCFSMWMRRRGLLGRDEWLDPLQWACTMVQASRCGYPMSLAQAGAALGLEQQKMTEGKNLIKVFCTPQKAKDGLFASGARVRPEDHPEDWQTFKDYCIRDVEVERQIDKALSWYEYPDFERCLYAADQGINDRGVLLDLGFVRNAQKADAVYKARLNEEAMRLTGLSNPNSVSQLKGWISEQVGVDIDSLTKKDLPDIIAATKDKRIHRVLQIRAEMGKTSNAKYDAMLAAVCPDGRVRGLLQFYGSRTGRWAGRLVQMQNLPQNHIDDLDFARQCVKDGDIQMIELGYGNVPDTLSQLIRTAFVAPEGKTLAVCDFSAIEARVLAWLAGETWVLQAFRDGKDIYCETASNMFHVPVEKHGRNAHLRQRGKVSVLALGYGGNVAALDAMGGKRMGMTEAKERETVAKWREVNPHIVEFWTGVETAASTCITTRETMEYRGLLFYMYEKTLCIKLPSGRSLCYPEACIGVNRFGGQSIRFKGVEQTSNKWTWLETYGGKLTENITQAVARDCLAVVIYRLEKLNRGLPILFHVHDEVICEVEAEHAESALENIKSTFDEPISWAPGLPLKGAGYITPYYMKD